MPIKTPNFEFLSAIIPFEGPNTKIGHRYRILRTYSTRNNHKTGIEYRLHHALFDWLTVDFWSENAYERVILAIHNKLINQLSSVGLQSIRPINYLIAEREEYKILCLVADVNCTRLAVIALANIFAAAPTEDHYGVTQLGLKSALGLFNRLVKVGLFVLLTPTKFN